MARVLLSSAHRSSALLQTLASGIIVAAAVIAVLYLGGEILKPLVVAGLLAFILAPLIRYLRVWSVPRVPSVLLTVTLAIALIAAIGGTVAFQVAELAQELPQYEANLRSKIRSLGAGPWTSRTLDRATDTLRELQGELSKSKPVPDEPKPLPVEVRQPVPRGLEAIAQLVRPLLTPLATSALVVLFLIFILLQREDIRDRFLRLAGTADLQRTTAALDDAGSRLSRFFLVQTLLNTGFGIIIAGGLWVIGVPNAVLWGILAGLMRFVPFIGGFIAAFFPIALAAAIDPGWGMVLATAALFLVAEPVAGHIVEPLLYGQHTGLSPVAVVVAALFWTLLWGPIGLLLATPLTVCLVVLGKHIEALEFLAVTLGDEPALEPEEQFYQRLLAGNAIEAAAEAEDRLKEQSLLGFYEAVPMRALGLAQVDAASGKLSLEKQAQLRDGVIDVVEDLAEEAEAFANGEAALAVVSRTALAPPWRVQHPVVCIGTRSPLDQAAAIMLGQVLTSHGLPTHVQPFSDLRSAPIDAEVREAPLVCLSYFGLATKPAHVRIIARRVRRLMPHAQIVACFWMLGEDRDKLEAWRKAVGADLAATSLRSAAEQILAAATAASPLPVHS
ncbi:MAG TPA: AI-2E family transporter [Hyphomicrobiaceae bacterium]|nr:AI-2E family transporter [Hyphomicrobiaceae bacterium]